MTVTCGGETFKVHKLIVCCRSDFFRAAIEGGFKEAESRHIHLPEDDSILVQKMLKYFYILDYDAPAVSDLSFVSELCFHLHMWAMGDKFGISALRTIAGAKFKVEIQPPMLYSGHHPGPLLEEMMVAVWLSEEILPDANEELITIPMLVSVLQKKNWSSGLWTRNMYGPELLLDYDAIGLLLKERGKSNERDVDALVHRVHVKCDDFRKWPRR